MLSLTYKVFIVVMFWVVDNSAPRLVVLAQTTLSPHRVVGDRETPDNTDTDEVSSGKHSELH